MNITAENRKKFADIIVNIDNFVKVRKNVIFERARFNQCSQGETETADQFITSLAADCEFGILKEQLIRDRIVVGIGDSQRWTQNLLLKRQNDYKQSWASQMGKVP